MIKQFFHFTKEIMKTLCKDIKMITIIASLSDLEPLFFIVLHSVT